MSYLGLGLEAAKAAYAARKENGAARLDKRDVLYKSGADFEESRAKDCLNQCCDLAATAQDDGMPMAEFDSQCAPIVHGTLRLPPIIAGDADFWRWLTFMEDGLGAEIVDWRYGSGHRKRSGSGPARSIYYGLEELKKGMFAKLWICANVMYVEDASDPYDGIEYADVDLWDSHVIDVDFGSSAVMARAFVKVIRDLKLPRGAANDPTVPAGFRDLAKEMRRRHAAIVFELFDDGEAYGWVKRLWEERESWCRKRLPSENEPHGSTGIVATPR
ncbi:MAG: hypothetical protein F4034_10235 [Chloroflexi bacterium]|nr:hypothetical protein [Chloroflexota bacterium]